MSQQVQTQMVRVQSGSAFQPTAAQQLRKGQCMMRQNKRGLNMCKRVHRQIFALQNVSDAVKTELSQALLDYQASYLKYIVEMNTNPAEKERIKKALELIRANLQKAWAKHGFAKVIKDALAAPDAHVEVEGDNPC